MEIIEAEACPDHIHMPISIPPKHGAARMMGHFKGKISLMIFDRHFSARGFCVDTAGENKKQIQEYIRDQLEGDETADQISIKELIAPFTGGKNPKAFRAVVRIVSFQRLTGITPKAHSIVAVSKQK